MAYSFYSQPRGPEVNVSLFPDSYSKGVSTGNAEGSTLSNLVKGIGTGLDLYGKYQDIQNNEQIIAQNEIKTQSMEQQASLQQELAPTIEDTARIKANNALLEEQKNAALLEQYNSLSKAATSGNKQAYADEVQSGKYAFLFAEKPELAKRAISDTFGYWNPVNQKSYIDEIAARQRKTSLDQAEKKANEDYEKSEDSFSKVFSPFTNGDNASFIQRTDIRPKDESYKYTTGEGGKKVLKEEFDPSSDKYNPVKDLPGFEIYDKKTGEALPIKVTQEVLGNYSNFRNNYNLRYKNVPGQDETGIGTLEEKILQAKKEKEALAAYAPTPVENGRPATQVGAEGFKINVNEKNARFRDIAKQRMQMKRTSPPTSYSNTPQSTPQDPATAITKEAPPIPTPTPEALTKKVSYMTDGADVIPNFTLVPDIAASASKNYDKINSLPGMEDKPAIFKGLVLVESRGNPDAVSPSGAKGLSQLMPETAREMGLNEDSVFNPELNANAGADYLQKQYDNVERSLTKSIASQGMPSLVDPRFVLAAYNGGFRYIKEGIEKGITDWDDMVAYLRSVKSDSAFKENTEYVDKVLTASLSFLKGGNASDDKYLKTLNTFGILRIV